LPAAEVLLREGDADFAAGRAYYAIFYAASALLFERGLSFRKHSAVHAAFGREFVQTGILDARFHRWLLDAFDKRLQADYGVDVLLGPEDVQRMIEQAREFVGEATRYLEGTVAD
jgi:uncharacterized protein (UPF0332 family)